MTATYSGCPCTGGNWPSITFNFTDNASFSVDMMGFRFKTPSFGGYSCFGGPAPTITGSGPYTYEQRLASWDQIRPQGSTLNTYSCGNGVPAGSDGTPYDMQLLIKTGSCNPPNPIATPTPNACSSIAAITAAPSYYSTACIPDTLGKNGGIDSGGFIDTFMGSTQIQVGLPTTPWTESGTNVIFDPTTMGGPMYMMASAMAQEYLNIDMQFLFGIGSKESFAAMKQVPGGALFIPTNASGVNGTYHVEVWTLGRVIMSYPNFFPRYACAAGAPDVTTAASYSCVSADGGWTGVGNWEMCTSGFGCPYIGSNSAQLVNSVFAGGMNFWWIYDALMLSTNLCFKTLLETGHDPQSALKILAPAYNLGINSGFESGILPASAGALAATDITPYVPTGNGNYMPEVVNTANKIAQASSCGGAPIYDANITLSDLQTFFFGNGGSAATPGDGGLWAQFPNLYSSSANRTTLWNDVVCAFNALSPHWGGSPAHISYRYDFLTILRVAKQYLNLTRPFPTQSDFTSWVSSRSTNSTACGTNIDTTFPVLGITSPSTTIPANECPNFAVNFTASDNTALQKAEWSMDPSWLSWNTVPGSSPFSFNVPGTTPNYPAPGAAGHLWIRVTDACGNATVQQLDFINNCGTPTLTSSMTSTPSATRTRSPTPSATPTLTLTATPSASPSRTVSPSSTYTLSASPSPTLTPTPSQTLTKSPTLTFSPTTSSSPTVSPGITATYTLSYSPTPTRTATPSFSVTSSLTSSPTLSPSPSVTLTRSPTATPSNSPGPSATPSFTATLSSTATPSLTPSVTLSRTASPSSTATLTRTPTQSATITLSPTLTPTAPGTFTETPSYTGSPTITPSRTLTLTLTLSSTPSATPTSSFSATVSSTRTSSPTLTLSPTPTLSSTASATLTRSATLTPSPTRSPTLTATPYQSPTVSPSVTQTSDHYVNQGHLIVVRAFYPNPFADNMKIYFTLRVDAHMKVQVYNVAGEMIKTIAEDRPAGPNVMIWAGANDSGGRCASGTYVVHVSGDGVDHSTDHFWGHAVIAR